MDIGSEIGAYNAAESGESLAECIALDIHRVRQRLAVQIWRDYQDHINARIRFADPDEDDKRRHESRSLEVWADRGPKLDHALNQGLEAPVPPRSIALCSGPRASALGEAK